MISPTVMRCSAATYPREHRLRLTTPSVPSDVYRQETASWLRNALS